MKLLAGICQTKKGSKKMKMEDNVLTMTLLAGC